MLETIIQALETRIDLKAWSVRHILTRGAQQYDLQSSTEAVRSVEADRYVVDVLRESTDADGNPGCGAGNVTLLKGGDISKALDEAAFMAGLVHNEPYDFPEPSPVPEVALADAQLQSDPLGTVKSVLSTLRDASAKDTRVRLTAAECFGEEHTTQLVNSHGIDATQVATNLHLEWVLIAGEGDNEVESFIEFNRRREADFDLEAELARRIQYAADLLVAETPKSFTGPVIVQGTTLATVMTSPDLNPMLNALASAERKYTGETPWEIGGSIFRNEVKGDPLNIWANRQLPYGMNSNCFDNEGIPAQRVELIRDNKLQAFTASKRYADYLGFPETGAFGDVELSPGNTSIEELVGEPHVEVTEFSWFNPNPITGEFACEIRLGYVVKGGERKPFKGGMLVGNLLDALADVHWSSETSFLGNYLGPTAARFNNLTVAGKDQA
jgi:PmbA protein